MNLKTFALCFLSALLAFLISFSLFRTGTADDTSAQLHSLEASLLEKLKEIEGRLGRIENRVAAVVKPDSERSPSRIDSSQSLPEFKNPRRAQNKTVQSQPNYTVFPSLPNELPRNWVSPKKWMASLSEDKREKVKLIIRDEATTLSEKMDAISDDDELAKDKVRSLVDENQNNLKKRMRELLTDEEYQGFLDTLPKPLAPFPEPLPESPRQ
jgi:hypothetical protein